MTLMSTRLVNRFASNETALGLPVFFTDPAVVEICGLVGYDWVSLIAEHAAMPPDVIGNLVRATSSSGISVLVHVSELHESTILPMLDLGVTGIVKAHASRPEHVRDLVAQVKFPPLGDRGLATSVRAARYGDVDIAIYTQEANANTLTGIVIEDAEALDLIDEILSEPGLDFAFLGLTDLTQSLGLPADFRHPKVLECIHRVVDAAKRTSVALGTSAKGHTFDELQGMGFRMVMTPISDAWFLRSALADHLSAIRR